MTNPMIERVARAHYEAFMSGVEGLEPRWGDWPEDAHDRYLRAMKAALSALLEPDEAMVEAAVPRPKHWPPRGEDRRRDAAIDADRMAARSKFTAMIKAIQEVE